MNRLRMLLSAGLVLPVLAAASVAAAQNTAAQQALRALQAAAQEAARQKLLQQQQQQKAGPPQRPPQPAQPQAPAGRGPATTTMAVVAGLPSGPALDIHGSGQLMFGELLQWRLVTEMPTQVRKGEGIKLGGVVLESADGRTKYRLSESSGFSNAENGPVCKVQRYGAYALIRCDKDYVFNTETGAAPVKMWPQFSDRGGASKNPQFLEEMPLPWWKPTGLGIKGTTYIFLDYGSVNYGTEVPSTEIPLGPALLDLSTGVIAVARTGPQANSPLYDASSEPENRPVATPSEGDGMTGRTAVGGRTVVTVNTTFDRCVDYGQNPCRGDRERGFKAKRALSYVFEVKP